MKKLIYLMLLSLSLSMAAVSNAQTTGTMNFSITVTEPSGGYNNKLVIAIWIEDSLTGNFVKTKLRYAVTEVQYLNVWLAKSNQNVVDAITGATTSPGTFSVVWNGTDVNGNIVPDGTYNVWIQFSDRNAGGPTKYCSFIKGPLAISGQTYPNSGNFTNMSLNWLPVTSDIKNFRNINQDLSVYPNPSNGLINICIALSKDCPVTLSVYNTQGQLVKHILNNVIADAGKNYFVWDGLLNNRQKAPKGSYYIKAQSNEFTKILKIVLQ